MNHLLTLLIELAELTANNSETILGLTTEPGVLQSDCGCDSILRVFLEELLNEVFGEGRDVLPLAIIELVFTLHVLLKDLLGGVSLE